ncbi:hypothetical protein HZH66_007669 [Vespula vulgaris]|uniref:Uncharacterized protein n=1 Tax=Vespula vulgaris TaxID=7454 RepID=A0A834JUN8_VESVU|nr:hypothetical protein HZH66_007669 [Vespula vulgaris]
MPFLPVLTNSLFKYITAYFIQDLNAKWGYWGSEDDNSVGSLADLYRSWFSCALDLDEIKSGGGDILQPVTTTKSGLGPTFTVTSSVVLWTSTRELRKFRGCHPCKY